ncbi:MAG TPA: HEAT repeat domain-containing protein, partial [Planctomycetaceae bacterium]|nr:HEAT repeat domain-containing protein [Planctomycetaceae bacterium]
KELQPESIEFLERSDEVFRQASQNPERVASLIEQLGGSGKEQAEASADLQRAGVTAVPALIQALNHPTSGTQRDMLQYTILRIGRGAVPALIGALDAPNPETRISVIQTLGFLGSDTAIPFLWYPSASPREPEEVRFTAREALKRLLRASSVGELDITGVANRLKRHALEHFGHRYPWKAAPDGTVPLWIWDAASGTVVQRHLTPVAASDRIGLEFARQALSLSDAREDLQVLYLGLALASEVDTNGWDKPLPTGPGTAHDLALSAGEAIVTRTVAEALVLGQSAAAVAGLRVLGEIGLPTQLQADTPQRAPILTALNSPDSRVQYAAAMAVLQIDPKQTFVGAERVVQILARAIATGGEPAKRAIVIDAAEKRAGNVAGLLGDLGYTATVATTGREGFVTASNQPEIDLVLIEANVARWPLSETLLNFRSDARTAGIPIAVYSDDETTPPATAAAIQRKLARYPMAAFIGEPLSSSELDAKLAPLVVRVSSPPLTESQQMARAAEASYWLAHIGQGRRTNVFNLNAAREPLFAALQNPSLVENALLALVAIPGRDVQQQMADVALNDKQPLEARQSAAVHLAFHIQRHGLLVPRETIDALHAAWEGSPEPTLRTAIAAVIGSLRPDAELVGKRLRAFGEAPAPEAPPNPEPPE